MICPHEQDGHAPRSLRLDGGGYDGEPFQVAVCGPDGLPLPAEGWHAA
ncbi:MAG TPA: hypothetical protein VF933_18670 [Streptosporangiaceae bacterium]